MRISDWSSDVCSSDLCGWPGGSRGGCRLSCRLFLVVGALRPSLRAEPPGRKEGAHAGGGAGGRPCDFRRLVPRIPKHTGLVTGETRRAAHVQRSEERRVGTACVSTCRYWWCP